MISALEAQLTAHRTKYTNIVENKIIEAASKGDMMCSISIDEIPNGTLHTLHEISCLLTTLGYKTFIESDSKLNIYWFIMIKPSYPDSEIEYK